MGQWLTELRRNLPHDIVLHIVGTKSDVVAREPHRREVPFERCIAYVAENLAPGMGSTPPPTATPGAAAAYTTAAQLSTAASSFGNGSSGLSAGMAGGSNSGGGGFFSSGGESPSAEPRSPTSKRSSGFWGQEVGWDACHEISAESGEGVEEVFRVVTRKLVEQNRKMQAALLAATSTPGLTPGMDGTSSAGASHDGTGGGGGYFDGVNARGSFRVGRDRRSWLFSPGFSPSVTIERQYQQQQQHQQGASGQGQHDTEDYQNKRPKKCC